MIRPVTAISPCSSSLTAGPFPPRAPAQPPPARGVPAECRESPGLAPPRAPGDLLGNVPAGWIIYRSDEVHPRHQVNFRVFEPLDFLAEVSAHIPDAYEKTTLFYGWYSNRTRGYRKQHGLLGDASPADPAADERNGTPLEVRRSWARLIRRSDARRPRRPGFAGFGLTRQSAGGGGPVNVGFPAGYCAPLAAAQLSQRSRADAGWPSPVFQFPIWFWLVSLPAAAFR